MRRLRNVKIVATLGPVSSDYATIRALFEAGADVFRLNMSHGTHDDIRARHAIIRQVAEDTGAVYLPVHERMAQVIVSSGREQGPAYTGSWRPGLESLVEHYMLGRSYDHIAQSAGFLLSPDGVHLDTAGARIVANLAGEFLAG